MSRILAALWNAPYRGKHPVPLDLRLDIGWFNTFARRFNGIVLLPPADRDTWVIQCDSSLKAGGAHSPAGFYSATYTISYLSKGYNIVQLEAINLIMALKALSPPEPSRFNIQVNTDNMTSQQVLETSSGRDPILCACSREIWLFAVCNSMTVTIWHKPGKELVFADAQSYAL